MNNDQGSLLVVDDDEMNRDMLSRRLSRQGHVVEIAADGQQALDMIAEQDFDVILLDIMMPGISGLEVLRLIRKSYSASELPVIMATAKGDADDVVTALKWGANDYVIKPLDFPIVLVRVQTQLEMCRRHKALQKRASNLEARVNSRFVEVDTERLRRLIATGENARFEMKSTLRWNLKSDKPGKEIEHAWLKNIVAFLNTNGGTLLVGIEDDGNVLGLEPDQFLNSDKYLLHVNNLIRDRIGMEFTQRIKFELKPLDGKDLLCIQCLPSPEAVFLKKDQDEEFYIRVGPSSSKLSSRETLRYMNDRRVQTIAEDHKPDSLTNKPIP